MSNKFTDLNESAEAVWPVLLGRALELIDRAQEFAEQEVSWSFGGGTVLMLRLNHRHSKDVDIFLADPQLLGMFSPRLSSHAEAATQNYDESSSHVKLFLTRGKWILWLPHFS